MSREFYYRAKNSYGKVVTGTVHADDKKAAAIQLCQQNLYITSFEPLLKNKAKKINKQKLIKKVNADELEMFCRNLSILLDAGVSMLAALEILLNNVGNKKLKRAISATITNLEAGQSVADSMKNNSGAFPKIMIGMLEVGEQSGRLSETFFKLAGYFEKERVIKEKVITALIYPAILLAFSLIMIIALIFFILPEYTEVLGEFNVELPASTKLLIKIGAVTGDFWYSPLVILIITSVAFILLRKNLFLKMTIHRLLLKLPVFGSLINKIVISRFARSFSDLMRSGMPLLQSLEICEKVIYNSVFKQAIRKSFINVQQGRSMVAALQSSGVFPSEAVEMMIVGEESGNLYEVLEKIADYYEQNVDVSLSRLSTILEPVLIIITGGVVGVIVLAMMMPLFDLVGSAYYME